MLSTTIFARRATKFFPDDEKAFYKQRWLLVKGITYPAGGSTNAASSFPIATTTIQIFHGKRRLSIASNQPLTEGLPKVGQKYRLPEGSLSNKPWIDEAFEEMGIVSRVEPSVANSPIDPGSTYRTHIDLQAVFQEGVLRICRDKTNSSSLTLRNVAITNAGIEDRLAEEQNLIQLSDKGY